MWEIEARQDLSANEYGQLYTEKDLHTGSQSPECYSRVKKLHEIDATLEYICTM